ncbi:MAG: aminopeptidase P family protein [Phycisphaerales bacterium]|nr:aminopeptidase P family protein [Phycisphaerales bacterium]
MAKKTTKKTSTRSSKSTLPAAPITLKEFKARRQKVARLLKDRAGVVFAGEHSASLRGDWEPTVEFLYLTGIADEPGAALLLDPSHPNPKRREVLLLRSRDPEDEAWHGIREGLSPELRDRIGVGTVFRTNRLNWLLTEAAARTGRLATLHEPKPAPARVNPDLAAYRLAAERVPGVAIDSAWREFYQLIAAKSPAERALVQKAIDATLAGVRAAATEIRPGANEGAVVRTLQATFAENGGEGNAFNPIAGSGVNATVLHYGANNRVMEDGDMLVLDSGTKFAGYCADITRTFPVNGRFNSTQADAYEIVLNAMRASIKACTVGTWMHDVDMAAREIIDKAGYGHAFYHGIGHHLGISVHDVDPKTPLRKDAIVTIEPGIYLPEENIGIRIEDDILVTSGAPANMSNALPVDRKGVEALMRG